MASIAAAVLISFVLGWLTSRIMASRSLNAAAEISERAERDIKNLHNNVYKELTLIHEYLGVHIETPKQSLVKNTRTAQK